MKINGFIASFMIVSIIPAACGVLPGKDPPPDGIDRPVIHAGLAQPVVPVADPALRLQSSRAGTGLIVAVPDILFECDAASLTAGHGSAIAVLAAFLKDHPGRFAMIEGYADSSGTAAGNQALSSRRAEAVGAALIRHGVGPERVLARGYGDSHPVARNDSSGGRDRNRRVAIVLSDGRAATPFP